MFDGIKDNNIKFLIQADRECNSHFQRGHDKHTAILYHANLSALPDNCPNCGFSTVNNVYLAGTDSAEYALPTANGFVQLLALTKQRFQCRTCLATFISKSHDFIEHTKVSRPLLLQIIDLAKRDLSEKNIAYILCLSVSKIHKLLSNAAEQHQTNYEHSLPEIINVNEIKYAKHRYGFEMVDDSTSSLIEIFPTRTNSDIEKYLSNYSPSNRRHVKYVVTDMNANYQTVLRKFFPEAELVIDRFHIIQLAMRAVQSTRINSPTKYRQ